MYYGLGYTTNEGRSAPCPGQVPDDTVWAIINAATEAEVQKLCLLYLQARPNVLPNDYPGMSSAMASLAMADDGSLANRIAVAAAGGNDCHVASWPENTGERVLADYLTSLKNKYFGTGTGSGGGATPPPGGGSCPSGQAWSVTLGKCVPLPDSTGGGGGGLFAGLDTTTLLMAGAGIIAVSALLGRPKRGRHVR